MRVSTLVPELAPLAPRLRQRLAVWPASDLKTSKALEPSYLSVALLYAFCLWLRSDSSQSRALYMSSAFA